MNEREIDAFANEIVSAIKNWSWIKTFIFKKDPDPRLFEPLNLIKLVSAIGEKLGVYYAKK